MPPNQLAYKMIFVSGQHSLPTHTEFSLFTVIMSCPVSVNTALASTETLLLGEMQG